jgi:hypothetical protein
MSSVESLEEAFHAIKKTGLARRLFSGSTQAGSELIQEFFLLGIKIYRRFQHGTTQ